MKKGMIYNGSEVFKVLKTKHKDRISLMKNLLKAFVIDDERRKTDLELLNNFLTRKISQLPTRKGK